MAACASAGSGATRVAPAVHADKADAERAISRDAEAPALLADGSDPTTIYLAETEMTSGACRFYVSRDRGAGWQAEQAPRLEPYTENCALGTATPQNIRNELVQGPDGAIYEVFQANAPGDNGGRSLLIGRSADKGRSWRTTAIAPAPAPRADDPGQEVELNFEGHIALDPADPRRIYAMWRRSFGRASPPRPTRPYMSVSNDGGATWAPAQVMFERNSGSDGPRPIVVGDQLWAFWREAAPPVPASREGPVPAPPLTRVLASVSTDGGRSWRDHEIASADDAGEPVAVYDRTRQRFSAVWHDNRSGDLDAYVSSSSDGSAWTRPTRLNDDARGNLRGQYFPQISQSPGGRLDVAWYDWRDDPFPPTTVGNGQALGLFSNRGKFASVYLTSSADGGRTWSGNVRVNDDLIDRTIGTWVNNADVMAPIAITSTPTAAVVAWSDTRNGNTVTQTQDIYTATVGFGRPPTARVTPFQTAVVGALLGAGLTIWLAAVLVRRPRQGRRGPGAPVRARPALR